MYKLQLGVGEHILGMMQEIRELKFVYLIGKELVRKVLNPMQKELVVI